MSHRSPGTSLSTPMRDLLWTVAQHKYGWTHVSRYRGQLQVADALVRRGVVKWGSEGREHHLPTIVATEWGERVIRDLWPVSPYNLQTCEHQPNGWDPRDGRQAA